MSGHSHWATIRHKKGAADAKRGKIFSKLAKAVISAARQGGGDPDHNIHLKTAIDAAKEASMPKDVIQRAIKRGTGELEGISFEEMTYEGYGPGGTALLIDILTDNRNRTSPEIRYIFERRHGKLGESGCVSWMFETKGFFIVERSAMPEEKMMDAAVEAGSDNVEINGDLYEITCEPNAFMAVKAALEAKGVPVKHSQISKIPKNYVPISDKDVARKILALVEALEDHDDVQNVFSNFDIPDEILDTIES